MNRSNMPGYVRLIPLAWAISPAAAETACPDIPALRYEEDRKELHAEHCDSLHPLSYVALGDSGERYVSFGGEVRQRYEYTHNPGLGADPQDARGAWLQRYALSSDLHWNDGLRTFVELHSALGNGRAAGPSPVDEDKLEFQNAFLEGRVSLTRGGDIRIRAGRQEMELGSARLISVRDGPNVRRTFDGLRIVADTGSWTINAIAMRPRRDRNATFDDSTDDSQLLWGFYATRAPDEERVLGMDAYYLVREDDEATYDQGTGTERRDTLGLRFFGTNSGWRWNVEPMVQFGEFGAGNVRAWTIASEAGYTWLERKWQPSLRLSANIASGDRSRSDLDLETFNPLYPRGNYFSEDSILGPQNFYNAHVFLALHPANAWTVTADYNFFWRMTTDDGVYGPNGSLLRSGEGSDERLVATALSLTSEWTVNRHLGFTAIYTHFSPRRFLEQTGPSDAVEFVELTARFRF
jgi:hypothetical protein